jgi:hypothetical protein
LRTASNFVRARGKSPSSRLARPTFFSDSSRDASEAVKGGGGGGPKNAKRYAAKR